MSAIVPKPHNVQYTYSLFDQLRVLKMNLSVFGEDFYNIQNNFINLQVLSFRSCAFKKKVSSLVIRSGMNMNPKKKTSFFPSQLTGKKAYDTTYPFDIEEQSQQEDVVEEDHKFARHADQQQ